MERERNVSCVPCPVHTSSTDNCCVNILTEECQGIFVFLLPLVLFPFPLFVYFWQDKRDTQEEPKQEPKDQFPHDSLEQEANAQRQTKDLLAEPWDESQIDESQQTLICCWLGAYEVHLISSLRRLDLDRSVCRHEPGIPLRPSSFFVIFFALSLPSFSVPQPPFRYLYFSINLFLCLSFYLSPSPFLFVSLSLFLYAPLVFLCRSFYLSLSLYIFLYLSFSLYLSVSSTLSVSMGLPLSVSPSTSLPIFCCFSLFLCFSLCLDTSLVPLLSLTFSVSLCSSCLPLSISLSLSISIFLCPLLSLSLCVSMSHALCLSFSVSPSSIAFSILSRILQILVLIYFSAFCLYGNFYTT